MKKLLHLGIASVFMIVIHSCSKSVNDLPANPVPKSDKATTVQKMMYPAPDAGINAQEQIEIYPYTNYPYPLKLGNPERSIIYSGSGEFAVFYVTLLENINSAVSSSTFTITDDQEGVFATYDLIDGNKALDFNLEVPKEIANQPFYFAIVPLTDLDGHMDSLLSLNAEIMAERKVFNTSLKDAFIYTR